MRLDLMKEDAELPQGVTCTVQGNNAVTVKGPKGEVTRAFPHLAVKVSVEGGEVVVSAKDATKKEKTAIGSIMAHVRNMLKGVTQGHAYRMKICSGHFPMNVSVAGGELVIKNFLGEKVPRKLRIKPGVTVKVEGQEIVVEGVALELVSQTAAAIEQLTRIRNRDLRVFQDGIYITSKDGEQVGQI
jgi:large subunit ribosomal protein L6